MFYWLESVALRLYLYVSFCECDHLRENVCYMKILHLIPLPTSLKALEMCETGKFIRQDDVCYDPVHLHAIKILPKL
jgi:hypothetical protein